MEQQLDAFVGKPVGKPEAKPEIEVKQPLGYIELRCLKCEQLIRHEYTFLSAILIGHEYRVYFHNECFKELEEKGLIVQFREV